MNAQLTRLRLENWRNFREVDVVLQPRVFIVGPNASGKTNLIDAIRFVHDIARPEGSLIRAVTSRGGFSHLRSLHARQGNVLVGLELTTFATTGSQEDHWVYELQLSSRKKGAVQVERERVAKNGTDLLVRPQDDDRRDPRLLQQTHLEQLSQNGGFRELVDALTSIVHVHVVPQVAKTAARSEEAIRAAPGSDFIDEMAKLPEKKLRGHLNRITKVLKRAVPRFSKLRVERDDLGRPHLEANFTHWRPQGGWQNEAEFSDGTLRLIGLLWAILTGDAPLLLEEPELSLHLAIVRQLPSLMAKAAAHGRRQIIVSTHSEEMLNDQGISPDEIIVLEPSNEHTRVSLARDDASTVRAAEAGVALGSVITATTRPRGIEQLSLGIEDNR